MTKAAIVTRKRGRPTSEESTAIALEKAMISLRGDLARLTPKAVATLEGLLQTGTEKVKETTAKYILEQAKEANNLYTQEDNEDTAAGGTASANAPAHSGSSEEVKRAIPLTTEIREYKMTGTEDDD